MQVIKRDDSKELVSFDKITKRITDISFDLKNVDVIMIAKETINGIFNGIKTSELDKLSAEICASKGHHHYEYNILGGRLLSSNNSKNTCDNYMEVVNILYNKKIVSEDFYNFVFMNQTDIQDMIVYDRDLLFDFFAMKTLERSYLFKNNGKIVERPQHVWMRVSIQIHAFIKQENILEKIKETYDLLSNLYFTHATPTLFNSATNKPQLSSCFLFSCEDNLEDIFKMISDIAKISKWAGGIGISLSNIRSKGSLIRGTNGKSEGIIPLCKTLEMTARYINQGGKRNGSIAVYLELFHADIYDFIELRKNTGDENLRARDLFIALWVCDLFMKRVQNDEDWTLMCPDECPGLVDSYGQDFEKLYLQYEKEKKGKKVVKSRDLWNHILENQLETGMPYISYKDTVNNKNMQKQLGVIRNSNLCVAPETMILTSNGYFSIQSLENKVVNVWNGSEFTQTTIMKTGENQELLKIVLSNGSELECTHYHKFYIKNKDNSIRQIEAKFLLKDDELIDCNFPIINETISEKNNVPYNSNIDTKIKWLKNLFDKEGYIDNLGIQLASNKNFLKNINFLLNTLGCNAYISKLDHYFYTLLISDLDILKLEKLGLKLNILKISPIDHKNPRIGNKIKVSEIIYTKRISDTFCFKEEKRGMGIFNGILTGQCNEIALFSNKDNYAVCNLASICLPRFIENGVFNFEKLQEISGIIIRNLNHVIDVNFYPTQETKKTNLENRPVGLGVQGLSDVFCILGIPFNSDEARDLNQRIFENIYYGSVKMSINLAKENGSYQSIINSPHSHGLLNFDFYENKKLTLDWTSIKKDLKTYGIRNSMLTALMPTASTSQIMQNNEAFEPYTSNIYIRKTLAGEFIVINQHLIKDLTKLGLWNETIYEEILYDNGSVQKIKSIPQKIKDIYKTAFELKITDILKQAVDRSPFIDHMQSMNLFMAKPDFNLLNSSHFYSWKNGLKTGMYYLRTQPIVDAIKFGLDPNSILRIKEERKKILKDSGVVDGNCPRDTYLRSICENCSS